MRLHEALVAYGLVCENIIADGEIHRCGTVRKPRSLNGWYSVHPSGKFATFGNWETGEGYERWQDGELNPQEFSVMRRVGEELRAKREAEYLKAADAAQAYFDSCSVDGYSDYLKLKRCWPHGCRFDGNVLIIPVQDSNGKIWSYQRISGDGSKYFMHGGRVRGGYYPIFGRNVAKDELVVVCEGFATGASIHQETGLPVVVAFNAGNIKAVCDSLVYRNLLIAADNDASGVGEKAAKDSGYSYVMPKVVGWDYSDVFLNGKDLKSDFNIIPATVKDEAIEVGGLVGDIAHWITSSAVRPQPMLSLAAAISFVGMLKGQRIRGRTNLRTNTLCLSLAPTGSGKEYPQQAIDRLAEACGLGRHMMGRPTSGTALLTGLDKAGCIALLTVDEMGRYMGNITAKGAGGFQREIADYMVELFSAAGRTFRGRQYANEKQNPQVIIEQPHFCCLGSTVPERLQAACTSAEVVDGFLNRWLVFTTNDRPEKRRADMSIVPPEHLVDKITRWLSDYPLKQDNYGKPQPLEVRFTPEAWDMFLNYDKKMEKAMINAIYPMDKLYSRSAEHVEKLALILAFEGFIGTTELGWAIEIVTSSNRAIMGFSGMIADNLNEQDFIRVREKIKEAKEVKRSWLTYNCQFVQGGARRIDEIVNVLLSEHVIVDRKVGNTTYYRWIG